MTAALIGNRRAEAYLDRLLEMGSPGMSLLFSGPSGVGKMRFALQFACKLLGAPSGHHPDLSILRPEGKLAQHSIDALREMSKDVYLRPFDGKYRVFIIEEADRMPAVSANALLKTLEEPSVHSYIILVTSRKEMLLPTIVSRCRTVYFRPLSEEEMLQALSIQGVSESEAKALEAFSGGSLERALHRRLEGESSPQKKLLDLLQRGRPTYQTLHATALEIAAELEAMRQKIQSTAQKELVSQYGGELSVAQRAMVEKQTEGVSALRTLRHLDALFEVILCFYRDLLVEQIEGQEEPVDAMSEQDLIRLEKAISNARLKFERSTPLALLLESLLLDIFFN